MCVLEQGCEKRWRPASPNLAALQPDGDLAPVGPIDVAYNATHSSFGMPRGVRYLPPGPRLNEELGRSFAWLPVTHTHTSQGALQVGLWFHYTRGCSDFLWNVGRTMLARNKCHAAALLEQRADKLLSWADAVNRVARKLLASLRHPKLLHVIRMTNRRGELDERPFAHHEVSRALASCAAGRGLASERPLLASIILSNGLDYISAATMLQDLVGTAAELDSLQFYNRCLPPLTTSVAGCDANVEVWDVRLLQQSMRALREAAAKKLPAWTPSPRADSSPVFGRQRAAAVTPCELSSSWHYCIACEDSISERACCFACSRTEALPSKRSDNRTTCKYGPTMEWHLLRRLNASNPLTLESAWSSLGLGTSGAHWWAGLGMRNEERAPSPPHPR